MTINTNIRHVSYCRFNKYENFPNKAV